jgi:glycosyltransferase involved in cell wall biosynthesis
MNVLMLGWELPPHNSGGLGVACYQLCCGLAKQNVDIEFVVPYTADHPEIDFMKVTAAHPQGVDAVWKTLMAYDSAKYVYEDGVSEWVDVHEQTARYEAAVERIAATQSFDLIHAHDWLTFRAALKAREVSGRPIVAHVHSVESDRSGGHGGNPLVLEIEALSLMLADRVVAVSQHTKRAIMRDYDIPGGKISVVHNSLDRSALEPLEADNAYTYLLALKQQGWRVVSNIGRLTIQKGLPNFLLAAKEVIAKAPKTMFVIVGDGDQFRELLLMAADMGIAKNVIFTGFQRGKRWRDAYAASDLFVMPSVSEPFGLTPLEAINYGTPSLISRQSGVSEVVNNILKVDFWDVREMANQITAAVQHDELRQELTSKLYQEFQSISWDSSVDKLLGIYRDHLREKAAA